MTRRFLKWALVSAMAFPVSQAVAQCGGSLGGGSGHEHGGSEPTRGEKKSEKMINELLSEESNRSLLMDAILSDPDFMRAFVKRIAELPEWRALAAERSGVVVQPAPTSQDGAPIKGSQASYVCPMHPEVTSDEPGKCPKCGMALRRTGP